MIIAVTAQGESPGSPIDTRFGRAPWFLFYDEEQQRWEPLANSRGQRAQQGAGILAAQQLAERHVQVLITGVTGLKAQQALKTAGVRIFHGANGTVEEALAAYRSGRLQEFRG